jgi:hypothetical protein
MTSHVLVIILAVITCSVGYCGSPSDLNEYGHRNGKREALNDIRNNDISIKAFGLPHPATAIYAEILKEKIDVRYDAIAGCAVDQALVEYANSYNSVVDHYLQDRYGKDILQTLWKEAEQRYYAAEAKKNS